MNTNPWFLERMADYERDRIQRDMKQILLEKEAIRAGHTEEIITKARLYRPRRLMQIMPTFVKWMSAWADKFANPPKSKSVHRAKGERQIMVAEVSDCTSCGD